MSRLGELVDLQDRSVAHSVHAGSVLGRSCECHVKLQKDWHCVSRKQAVLTTLDGTTAWIENIGSGKMWLNDIELQKHQPTPLTDDDVLKVATTNDKAFRTFSFVQAGRGNSKEQENTGALQAHLSPQTTNVVQPVGRRESAEAKRKLHAPRTPGREANRKRARGLAFAEPTPKTGASPAAVPPDLQANAENEVQRAQHAAHVTEPLSSIPQQAAMESAQPARNAGSQQPQNLAHTSSATGAAAPAALSEARTAVVTGLPTASMSFVPPAQMSLRAAAALSAAALARLREGEAAPPALKAALPSAEVPTASADVALQVGKQSLSTPVGPPRAQPLPPTGAAAQQLGQQTGQRTGTAQPTIPHVGSAARGTRPSAPPPAPPLPPAGLHNLKRAQQGSLSAAPRAPDPWPAPGCALPPPPPPPLPSLAGLRKGSAPRGGDTGTTRTEPSQSQARLSAEQDVSKWTAPHGLFSSKDFLAQLAAKVEEKRARLLDPNAAIVSKPRNLLPAPTAPPSVSAITAQRAALRPTGIPAAPAAPQPQPLAAAAANSPAPSGSWTRSPTPLSPRQDAVEVSFQGQAMPTPHQDAAGNVPTEDDNAASQELPLGAHTAGTHHASVSDAFAAAAGVTEPTDRSLEPLALSPVSADPEPPAVATPVYAVAADPRIATMPSPAYVQPVPSPGYFNVIGDPGSTPFVGASVAAHDAQAPAADASSPAAQQVQVVTFAAPVNTDEARTPTWDMPSHEAFAAHNGAEARIHVPSPGRTAAFPTPLVPPPPASVTPVQNAAFAWDGAEAPPSGLTAMQSASPMACWADHAQAGQPGFSQLPAGLSPASAGLTQLAPVTAMLQSSPAHGVLQTESQVHRSGRADAATAAAGALSGGVRKRTSGAATKQLRRENARLQARLAKLHAVLRAYELHVPALAQAESLHAKPVTYVRMLLNGTLPATRWQPFEETTDACTQTDATPLPAAQQGQGVLPATPVCMQPGSMLQSSSPHTALGASAHHSLRGTPLLASISTAPSNLSSDGWMPQGPDHVRPFSDPERLRNLPVWRRWPMHGWACGLVGAWNAETLTHRVRFNAHTDLEFEEELDLINPGISISWRDPELVIPTAARSDAQCESLSLGVAGATPEVSFQTHPARALPPASVTASAMGPSTRTPLSAVEQQQPDLAMYTAHSIAGSGATTPKLAANSTRPMHQGSQGPSSDFLPGFDLHNNGAGHENDAVDRDAVSDAMADWLVELEGVVPSGPLHPFTKDQTMSAFATYLNKLVSPAPSSGCHRKRASAADASNDTQSISFGLTPPPAAAATPTLAAGASAPPDGMRSAPLYVIATPQMACLNALSSLVVSPAASALPSDIRAAWSQTLLHAQRSMLTPQDGALSPFGSWSPAPPTPTFGGGGGSDGHFRAALGAAVTPSLSQFTAPPFGQAPSATPASVSPASARAAQDQQEPHSDVHQSTPQASPAQTGPEAGDGGKADLQCSLAVQPAEEGRAPTPNLRVGWQCDPVAAMPCCSVSPDTPADFASQLLAIREAHEHEAAAEEAGGGSVPMEQEDVAVLPCNIDNERQEPGSATAAQQQIVDSGGADRQGWQSPAAALQQDVAPSPHFCQHSADGTRGDATPAHAATTDPVCGVVIVGSPEAPTVVHHQHPGSHTPTALASACMQSTVLDAPCERSGFDQEVVRPFAMPSPPPRCSVAAPPQSTPQAQSSTNGPAAGPSAAAASVLEQCDKEDKSPSLQANVFADHLDADGVHTLTPGHERGRGLVSPQLTPRDGRQSTPAAAFATASQDGTASMHEQEQEPPRSPCLRERHPIKPAHKSSGGNSGQGAPLKQDSKASPVSEPVGTASPGPSSGQKAATPVSSKARADSRCTPRGLPASPMPAHSHQSEPAAPPNSVATASLSLSGDRPRALPATPLFAALKPFASMTTPQATPQASTGPRASSGVASPSESVRQAALRTPAPRDASAMSQSQLVVPPNSAATNVTGSEHAVAKQVPRTPLIAALRRLGHEEPSQERDGAQHGTSDAVIQREAESPQIVEQHAALALAVSPPQGALSAGAKSSPGAAASPAEQAEQQHSTADVQSGAHSQGETGAGSASCSEGQAGGNDAAKDTDAATMAADIVDDIVNSCCCEADDGRQPAIDDTAPAASAASTPPHQTGTPQASCSTSSAQGHSDGSKGCTPHAQDDEAMSGVSHSGGSPGAPEPPQPSTEVDSSHKGSPGAPPATDREQGDPAAPETPSRRPRTRRAAKTSSEAAAEAPTSSEPHTAKRGSPHVDPQPGEQPSRKRTRRTRRQAAAQGNVADGPLSAAGESMTSDDGAVKSDMLDTCASESVPQTPLRRSRRRATSPNVSSEVTRETSRSKPRLRKSAQQRDKRATRSRSRGSLDEGDSESEGGNDLVPVGTEGATSKFVPTLSPVAEAPGLHTTGPAVADESDTKKPKVDTTARSTGPAMSTRTRSGTSKQGAASAAGDLLDVTSTPQRTTRASSRATKRAH